MKMGQRVETDPEKVREWQLDQLTEYARAKIDSRRPEFKQSFITFVAGEAVRKFHVHISNAMSLAEEACKTVFAERGWTF